MNDLQTTLGNINEEFNKWVIKTPFVKDKIEKLILDCSTNRKKLLFYCAGNFAQYILEEYDFSGVDIAGIVDNNPSKHGQYLFGQHKITSAANIKESYNPGFIFISTVDVSRIYPHLRKEMGDEFPIFYLFDSPAVFQELFEQFVKENKTVANLVEESRKRIFTPETQIECSYVVLSGLSNADSLDKMLESFVNTTDNLNNSEIIIVSNGSHDHTYEVVHKNLKNHDYILIHLNPNRGIAGGFNEGIKKASGKYICVLQDDVVIHQENWSNVLSAFLDKHEKIGAIGFWPEKLPDLKANEALIVNQMYCFAMMFRNSFGLWDTLFNPNSFEDVDFTLRIRKQGFDVCAINLDIYHPPIGALSPTSATRKIGAISNKVSSHSAILRYLLQKRHEDMPDASGSKYFI